MTLTEAHEIATKAIGKCNLEHEIKTGYIFSEVNRRSEFYAVIFVAHDGTKMPMSQFLFSDYYNGEFNEPYGD